MRRGGRRSGGRPSVAGRARTGNPWVKQTDYLVVDIDPLGKFVMSVVGQYAKGGCCYIFSAKMRGPTHRLVDGGTGGIHIDLSIKKKR